MCETFLNIIFVGLPGSGKTTIGRQLARRLGLPFVDSDHVIEERLGCSIREYFAREGEDAFRDVEQAVQRAAVRYDKDGDQHYDVISAFIKSVRGSDPDAAVHYLARMLEAGEDPRFIARRLMILASEDIGMADPAVLPAMVAAAQSVAMVGMPEAQIILAHATIHAALAPKSNAVVVAIGEATADIRRGRVGAVPPWLRDAHYPGAASLGHGTGYVYPHDVPGGVAAQRYLPDDLAGAHYYRPSSHGAEAGWGQIAERLRQAREGERLGLEPPSPQEPS